MSCSVVSSETKSISMEKQQHQSLWQKSSVNVRVFMTNTLVILSITVCWFIVLGA